MANTSKEDMIQLEYTSLREELARNKQYVFERPLVIIAAIGLALVELKDTQYLIILPLLLIITTWTNLDLTVNRLWSSSRIASYIGVVLEPPFTGNWIGWENSLRAYRKWKNDKNNMNELLDDNSDDSAIPDSMMFYPTIFKFHLAIMIIAIALSGFMFLYPQKDANMLWYNVCFWSSIAIFILFVHCCQKKYDIDRIKKHIELERKVWKAIFPKENSTEIRNLQQKIILVKPASLDSLQAE